MTKKKLVNAETNNSVIDYLEAVDHEQRKADSFALLELFQNITKEEARLWGNRMVGFGKFSYKRKNGDEFEWFKTGFAPAKAHMTIYLSYDINEEVELLSKLGPYKTGKGCLYIKRLSLIDLEILQELIMKSKGWEQE